MAYKISFEYTPQVLRQALLASVRPRMGRIGIPGFIFLGLFVVVSSIFLISQGEWEGAIWLSVVPLLFVFCWFLLFFVQIKQSYEPMKRVEDHNLEYILDEEGIVSHSALGEGRTSWKAFTRLHKGRKVWLLYMGRVFMPIPAHTISKEAGDFLVEKIREEGGQISGV